MIDRLSLIEFNPGHRIALWFAPATSPWVRTNADFTAIAPNYFVSAGSVSPSCRRECGWCHSKIRCFFCPTGSWAGTGSSPPCCGLVFARITPPFIWATSVLFSILRFRSICWSGCSSCWLIFHLDFLAFIRRVHRYVCVSSFSSSSRGFLRWAL